MVCALPIYSANKQLPRNQRNIREVTSLEELNIFLKPQKIVFIDFYKDSCSPCEQFEFLYENWVGLFKEQIIFLKINASDPETDDLCKKFGITCFPTLIVVDNEKEIARHKGMKEIKEMNIKRFLAHLED
jgi:thiol-disulfide isomerase/thioredoxin